MSDDDALPSDSTVAVTTRQSSRLRSVLVVGPTGRRSRGRTGLCPGIGQQVAEIGVRLASGRFTEEVLDIGPRVDRDDLGRKNYSEVFVPDLGTFDSWLHQRAGIDFRKEDAAPKKITGRARTMELARSREKFRVAGRANGEEPRKKIRGRPVAKIRSIPVNSGHNRFRRRGPSPKSGQFRSIPVTTGFPDEGPSPNSGHFRSIPVTTGFADEAKLYQSGQKRTFPDTCRIEGDGDSARADKSGHFRTRIGNTSRSERLP